LPRATSLVALGVIPLVLPGHAAQPLYCAVYGSLGSVTDVIVVVPTWRPERVCVKSLSLEELGALYCKFRSASGQDRA